jgi:hypothetical protein
MPSNRSLRSTESNATVEYLETVVLSESIRAEMVETAMRPEYTSASTQPLLIKQCADACHRHYRSESMFMACLPLVREHIRVCPIRFMLISRSGTTPVP